MSSFSSPVRQGDLLWQPDPSRMAQANLAAYLDWLEREKGSRFSGYAALWKWSVDDLEGFWASIAEWFGVRFHRPPSRVLAPSPIAEARWFPGALLNYAEQALGSAHEEGAALLFQPEPIAGEAVPPVTISRNELRRRVSLLAAELKRLGVGKGDRVVGYFTNSPEAVVSFLAAASLGAVWSNCAAELSGRGVVDRYAQIEPKVLLAVDGYRYGGKLHDRRAALAEIVAGLPTLQNLILVRRMEAPLPAALAGASGLISWDDLFIAKEAPPLAFEPVPFDHPLWILYSSGTTGAPKAIVQGHGGILLEHLKALSLHFDLRPGDRFFWYTSSGWMMWNMLISGLLLPGVTVVLYDGSPKHPDFCALWDFVDREGIAYFGTSAPFLLACLKEGLDPARRFGFDRLRSLGSTGAPLPPEGFAWVYEKVKDDLLLGSASGGTDVCTAFVLSHPALPVHAGELQCLGLGAKIEVWDEAGKPVFGQVGELVLTAPFPPMPVAFWNDPGGARLRASYYEKAPGAWCHGDWIEVATPAVRCVIHGRSDSTLNRGGIRMGTSEFYAVVEGLPEIAEALVIDTGGLGREDRLLLFVVLRVGHGLDDALRNRLNGALRLHVSPRHVPDAIAAVPEIPHTLNGKKLEVPVKRILTGTPLDKAVSREAVANPESLRYFVELAATLSNPPPIHA